MSVQEEKNDKAAMKSLKKVLRDLLPDGAPASSSQMVVEFPGATTSKVGTSSMNTAHIRWVMDQVKTKFLSESVLGVGSNAGRHAEVLITTPYGAQCQAYHAALSERINDGRLPAHVRSFLKINTVSRAVKSKAEADIHVCDFVQTDHPGFVGSDPALLAGTATLSRGVCLFMLNRGMFVGRPANDDTDGQVARLWSIYQPFYDRQAILRVPTCSYCGDTVSQEHDLDCSGEPPGLHLGIPSASSSFLSTIQICQRGACRDSIKKKRHTYALCPRRKCGNCAAFGHSANECLERLICTNCRGFGHLHFSCPEMAIIFCDEIDVDKNQNGTS